MYISHSALTKSCLSTFLCNTAKAKYSIYNPIRRRGVVVTVRKRQRHQILEEHPSNTLPMSIHHQPTRNDNAEFSVRRRIRYPSTSYSLWASSAAARNDYGDPTPMHLHSLKQPKLSDGHRQRTEAHVVQKPRPPFEGKVPPHQRWSMNRQFDDSEHHSMNFQDFPLDDMSHQLLVQPEVVEFGQEYVRSEQMGNVFDPIVENAGPAAVFLYPPNIHDGPSPPQLPPGRMTSTETTLDQHHQLRPLPSPRQNDVTSLKYTFYDFEGGAQQDNQDSSQWDYNHHSFNHQEENYHCINNIRETEKSSRGIARFQKGDKKGVPKIPKLRLWNEGVEISRNDDLFDNAGM